MIKQFKEFLVEGAEEKAHKLAKQLSLTDDNQMILDYLEIEKRKLVKPEYNDISKIKTEKQLMDMLLNHKEVFDRLKEKKAEKEASDNFTVFEEDDRYKVLEIHSHLTAFKWSPKQKNGDAVWCVGWKTQEKYWEKYKKYGNRILYVINKEKNLKEAEFAFMIDGAFPMESQYKDIDNIPHVNLSKSKMNDILKNLPKTKKLILSIQGKDFLEGPDLETEE